MSFLDQYNIIRYACSCGELKPIYRLYFCRHCLKIRCGFCVSHEVDSYYCISCTENYPAAEAWTKKYSCGNCFSCPNCHANLTVRMTTAHKAAEKSEEGSTEKSETPKKAYFLICFSCQWSTRDVGLPDADKAVGGWNERVNDFSDRMNSLVEHFKVVALIEKLEREKRDKKSTAQRRNYAHISGMSKATAMKKAGLNLSVFGLGSLSTQVRKPPEVETSKATNEINDLPADIFTSVPDLYEVATLEQRLGQLEYPVEKVKDLCYYKRSLFIKTSQRCRTCEHNVSKPEYNPTSIRFKIQLSAFYHVPEIRIRSCEPLYAGKVSNIILRFTNPTQHQSNVQLLMFGRQVESVSEYVEDTSEPTSLVTKVKSLQIEPRSIVEPLNGIIELPTVSYTLPQRDDMAEYDDFEDVKNVNNDPHVVWFNGNKVAIKLEIKPNEDLAVGTDVIVGFLLSYTYTNTMMTKKEQQKTTLSVNVVINAGKIQAA